MIVIEGTDMVGKTTLAQRMVELFPTLSYAHLGLLPNWWDYYHSYLDYRKPNVVQDRLFLSEIAYGNATRGYTHISDTTLKLLRSHFYAEPFLTVLIRANDTDILKERFSRLHKREAFDLYTIIRADVEYAKLEQYADMVIYLSAFPSNRFPLDETATIIHDAYLEVQSEYNEVRTRGRKETLREIA